MGPWRPDKKATGCVIVIPRVAKPYIRTHAKRHCVGPTCDNLMLRMPYKHLSVIEVNSKEKKIRWKRNKNFKPNWQNTLLPMKPISTMMIFLGKSA